MLGLLGIHRCVHVRHALDAVIVSHQNGQDNFLLPLSGANWFTYDVNVDTVSFQFCISFAASISLFLFFLYLIDCISMCVCWLFFSSLTGDKTGRVARAIAFN